MLGNKSWDNKRGIKKHNVFVTKKLQFYQN